MTEKYEFCSTVQRTFVQDCRMHRKKKTKNQLDQQKSCLSVSFTACRTSLILQQYSNGFKDELK